MNGKKLEMIEHPNFWKKDLTSIAQKLEYKFIPNGTTPGYEGLSHDLVDRIENMDNYNHTYDRIISPYWESHFGEIFYAFTKAHNIKVDRVFRAAVNLTINHVNEWNYAGIHIDHYFPYSSFLMPLNDFTGGDTYLFDKFAKDGDPNQLSSPQPVYKKIKHMRNQAICFDGNQYHAQGFCDANQWRMMLVITFAKSSI
jgi:hypothetical protein